MLKLFKMQCVSTRNQRIVYRLFPVLIVGGILYVVLSMYGNVWLPGCLFKKFSSIPCASCGTTRSLVLIFHGEFYQALRINFLGYIAAISFILLPFWIAADVVFKNKTLAICYESIQVKLRKKALWIPLAILLMLQWMWGIFIGN